MAVLSISTAGGERGTTTTTGVVERGVMSAVDATKIGATMVTEYAQSRQLMTSVDVDFLRDMQTSMKEEFWIFTFGGFLASGSFWIVVERFFSREIDTLFWVCVVALVAGLVIGLIGYTQLGRRKTKIGRKIDEAEAWDKARAAAAAPTLTVVK